MFSIDECRVSLDYAVNDIKPRLTSHSQRVVLPAAPADINYLFPQSNEATGRHEKVIAGHLITFLQVINCKWSRQEPIGAAPQKLLLCPQIS